MTDSQSPVPASRGSNSPRRTHLRTPPGDLSLLAIPPLERLGETAAGNAGMFSRIRCSGASTPLIAPCPEERREARRAVWDAARRWTDRLLQAAGESSPAVPAGHAGLQPEATRWVVTGHQPALFHPGVWVKNFVVSELARQTQGVGLNLVVDNDTATPPVIRVPGGELTRPEVRLVPYDQASVPAPWEELSLVQPDLFDSFPERVEESLGGLFAGEDTEILLRPFWNTVRTAQRHLSNPAWAFSAARAVWERRWGAGNLEFPLSQLCELECFRRFAGRVLADLPRLHGIYNSVLADYRRINKLRSRTHPVPDLRRDGEWLEAPFWIWREGETQRRRLMVRTRDQQVELSDGRECLIRYAAAGDEGAAGQALATLSRERYRLRTRALSTTLFSRLYVADLFVHGIGGAKYDEMTDRIIEQFWGMTPPAFATLSATVRLPLAGYPESSRDIQRLQGALRDLDQHPERYLDAGAGGEGAGLVMEKRQLIREQQEFRQNRLSRGTEARYLPSAGQKRYRRLQQINRELSHLTTARRRELLDQLSETERRVAANAILQNREYACCLYPVSKLRRFFEHVCRAVR